MAASRPVLLGFTAGIALATAAFQIQTQRIIKNIESQKFEPASRYEPAYSHETKEDRSPQTPQAPALSSKERRQLYETLKTGRTSMIHSYDHGIRKKCEERCDELERPCSIYRELEKLHERCKKGSV